MAPHPPAGVSPTAAAQQHTAPSRWVQLTDEASGDYFYENLDTGQTMWEEPDEGYEREGAGEGEH